MLSYPDIFNFLMLYPSKLDIKELSDYKNSKAYSYYNEDGFNICTTIIFQEVNLCIIRGECRKSQSIKTPFQKLWIMLEKTAK